MVTVCKADPILNEDGSETGLWHLAGEFCPEDQLHQICLVQFDRTPVGDAVAADNAYLYSNTESLGVCTVHTAPPEPEPELPPVVDPFDPSTWFPSTDPTQPSQDLP